MRAAPCVGGLPGCNCMKGHSRRTHPRVAGDQIGRALFQRALTAEDDRRADTPQDARQHAVGLCRRTGLGRFIDATLTHANLRRRGVVRTCECARIEHHRLKRRCARWRMQRGKPAEQGKQSEQMATHHDWREIVHLSQYVYLADAVLRLVAKASQERLLRRATLLLRRGWI